jgi:hypothetical protein
LDDEGVPVSDIIEYIELLSAELIGLVAGCEILIELMLAAIMVLNVEVPVDVVVFVLK